MKEIVEQIVRYLRGMWHRRWIGLCAAWIAGIVLVAVAYKIPERYEAQARVYVDTESLLKPLLQGLAVQPNVDQQVGLISRTLISRPNVERLIRMADLDLNVRSPSQREDLVDQVIRTIRLTNVSSNLYVISYRDPNPDKARRVVQSLLNIFVDSSLGDKRQDTQSAVKFLDEQIKRYEDSLRTAENRLKDYKLKYLGVADRDTDYFRKMSQLRGDIESARMDLASYEQARDSYKRELSVEVPNYLPEAAEGVGAGAVATPELDRRISAVQTEIDALLRKYTEQHPDVQYMRRQLAQLEQQRKEEVAARTKAAAERAAQNTAQGATTNPVYQQLKISLADAEASVAAAKGRLDGLEGQYNDLRAKAQLVPQAEAEFAQLNRDYDVQKKTYENLLSRREAAAMGKDVQDTGGTQFRVIDPPRVSPEPVFPNRIVLLAVACVIALGIGFVAALAASQLRPTFHDSRTLRDVVKRPILGMVSMIPGDVVLRRRRRERVLFAGALGSLLCAFAGVITLATLVYRVA